jgi:hypothetical protein
MYVGGIELNASTRMYIYAPVAWEF